jgi:hypothetical protein
VKTFVFNPRANGPVQPFRFPLCISITGQVPERNKAMKRFLTLSAAMAAVATLSLANVQAGTADAGAVDFGSFTPAPGAEFVEVNVTSNIISMVTSLAAKSEPEVADALKGLKAIHVNVLGINASNRTEVHDRIDSVRADLTKAGWERVVTVMKGKDDVGVFMKTRGTEAVEGVVVTVLQGDGHAVFVNVVGDIRPEKLAMVGERFNIEPLKHLK